MVGTAAWLVWVGGGYLIGSVPVGLLIGLARGVDIRRQGSGNLGATNTGRVLGRTWGVICFLLDTAKGLGPTLAYGLAAGELSGDDPVGALRWLVVAAATVVGHVFPIWLRFRGGKGVATVLGSMLGFWPVLTLPALALGGIWFVVVWLTGYVSLASISAAGALPLLVAVGVVVQGRSAAESAVFVGATSLLAGLVVLRHRTNIARLRAGTEPKVGGNGSKK